MENLLIHNQHRGPVAASATGKCSRCGGARTTAQRYCRGCKAADRRERRAAGREVPPSPEQKRRHAVRYSSGLKLRRWGIRPLRCMVCLHLGDPTVVEQRLELHHPSYDGARASWLVVVAHRACHAAIHAGARPCPPPVDLASVYWTPAPYFERTQQQGSTS